MSLTFTHNRSSVAGRNEVAHRATATAVAVRLWRTNPHCLLFVQGFALTRLRCPAVILFRNSLYGLLMIDPLFPTLGKELFSPTPVGEIL